MTKRTLFLLILFISFNGHIKSFDIKTHPTLVALVNTVINAVLKEQVNSNAFKVEVYPTINKDFVITKASHYIAGKKTGKKWAMALNETLLLGIVRVGIQEQLKTETINNMRANLFASIYVQLKEQHPEWDEEQLQLSTSALTTNEIESKQELIQQQIEEFSQTEEFTTLVHNRWMYYTKRHLGGVMIREIGSELMQKDGWKDRTWLPRLYDGSVHTTCSTIAGIRASVPTLPILTNLSSKVHPNLTIKDPSLSLDYAIKKSENTQSFIVGVQATLFHSELLKIKIKCSKNLSGGPSSCGIFLQTGM